MLLQNLTSLSTVPQQTCPDAISAEGVSLRFWLGSELLQVLNNIDITVNRGDVHLLMGPSGSGKTTLLSILAGVLQPTQGHVKLLGQEITAMSRSQLTRFRLENIGFIFQSFNLFPALTAVENVEVALNLRGIVGKEARQRALDFLEQVGLVDQADQRTPNLSGGQQQRVAIARALSSHPKLLMADEPTACLDAKTGHRVLELLCQLTKECQASLVVVTHDLDSLYVADQVTYLDDGKVRQA